MNKAIPFNKPCFVGPEMEYIRQAVANGKLSGNGEFTKRCQRFFEERYGFKKCLLTTSCTDALEMAAILSGVGPGDEVIVPSYTFVSSALAFVRTGATIVFADSAADQPNIDADKIESLITSRTKVIIPVHYAGCACEMDKIMAIAEKHSLIVVEDAAQAVDSFYHYSTSDSKLQTSNSKPLGGIGHLAAFSFHETKNINAGGEGGLLVINDERFLRRAEIVWEKGTNRAEFFRGEVNKYGWVDTGSSFLASELCAAYLWAQLENLEKIQNRRKAIWQRYYDSLKEVKVKLPVVPEYATNNAHAFYLLMPDLEKRTDFIAKMKARGISCPFHYLPLHSSEYITSTSPSTSPSTLNSFPNCDRYADCLVRLPLYYELSDEEVDTVIAAVAECVGG